MENKTSLKEFVSSYEGGQSDVKNISELDVVMVDYPIEKRTGTDKAGESFTYYVVCYDHFEYRIPKSMMIALKETLEERPNLKSFKVKRKGTTKEDTKYTFIALE